VLFETGYGPSACRISALSARCAHDHGAPCLSRTLTEDKIKTRLIAFSDDMDGMRKVPDNVPNKDMLASHLGKPLTRVPDPFSNEYPSFGAANNARLRVFLDQFGFDYEFASVDRLLHIRPVRRDAAEDARAMTRSWTSSCRRWARIAGDLFAVPADQQERVWCCRCR
jgi:lysyl-tRNA synthetase class I